MPCSALTRRPAFLLWLLLLLPLPLFAQATYAPPATTRERIPLDGAWRFEGRPLALGMEQPGFDDHDWQAVTVPHTWNSKTNLQTHQAAWYRTHFALTEADRGKEIFVCFDGAATVADVYLNGTRLGQHRGAYTRFNFDATQAAVFGGDNVLAVQCDTNPDDTADCLPAGDGYQLYHVPGGLYRPVWLLKTAPVHIDPTDDAASGVFLNPQAITAADALLGIKTLVRNDADTAKTVTVTNTVCDADDHVIAAVSETLVLGPRASSSTLLNAPVPHPRLWSPAAPDLYHVYTETRVDGKVTDLVAERTGFRTVRMTAQGVFLNDVLTPLRGVAKHQETEERASAVTPADLTRDWDDLKELGVNFVRLAHYPHAALEYDLADERGMVVWAENGHSNPDWVTLTGDKITQEMVLQNYNHPSICFWSIGNEAIQYLSDITTLEHYAAVVRAEDPQRLVTYASNTLFHESPALDFVAVNRYDGWYYSLISSFEPLATRYRYISETGAGGVVSIHSAARQPPHKVNSYEPEEYQQEVAEARCQTVFRNAAAQIPLFTWWTFRDFADPRYKGLNSKGLETYSGFRKEIWYLFQTFLRPDLPVVHLCSKPWFLRRRRSRTDIFGLKAYSNAAALTLTLNGKTAGTVANGEYVLPNKTRADNVFFWNASLKRGRNDVAVSDGLGHSDSAVLYFETGDEGLVRNLTSSNRANPAYFIDQPVQAEWPFYDDFDGTGDNTFHALPDILQGARWITTSRLSKPVNQAALAFTLALDAGSVDVFVMFTPTPALSPAFLAGFSDTGLTGTWRDNALNLVPYALYRRTVTGGATVRMPGATLDYVILIKPHPPEQPPLAPPLLGAGGSLPTPQASPAQTPRKSGPRQSKQGRAPAPECRAWCDAPPLPGPRPEHAPAESPAANRRAVIKYSTAITINSSPTRAAAPVVSCLVCNCLRLLFASLAPRVSPFPAPFPASA